MKKTLPLILLVSFVLLGITFLGRTASITQLGGIAVAQNSKLWNNVKDAAVGDNQTKGILLETPCLWNTALTSCSRQQGEGGASFVIPQTSGTSFFAVKRDNIAGSSVNLAYGFTSRKVALEFPLTNTDEVCVDWLGGTAVCPTSNTAGDDRYAPGSSIILDDYAGTSISVISASGTQTVYVRAWR